MPPSAPSSLPPELARFSRAERTLHWGNALAIAWLALTGLLIWAHLDKPKALGINVISQGHSVLGGGALLLGALYFLLRPKRAIPHADKRFNVGQRANYWLVIGALSGQALLGLALYFGKSLGLPRPTRGLVEQVHLLGAVGIGLVVVAHLVMVFLVPKNRGIFKAMWTGHVGREVAARSSPAWTAALTHDDPTP